jgi:hypothetical protein
MARFSIVLLLLVVGACADQSKGAALNECRLRYDIRTAADAANLVPPCMQARSYRFVSACTPRPSEADWDPRVATFPFDNPQCYGPVDPTAWAATLLSPM